MKDIPLLMNFGFIALFLMFGVGLRMVTRRKETHTQYIGLILLALVVIVYFSVLPFLYDITVDK